MRLFFLVGLSLLLNGCRGDGNAYHPGYVISKSHEAVADSENATEPESK